MVGRTLYPDFWYTYYMENQIQQNQQTSQKTENVKKKNLKKWQFIVVGLIVILLILAFVFLWISKPRNTPEISIYSNTVNTALVHEFDHRFDIYLNISEPSWQGAEAVYSIIGGTAPGAVTLEKGKISFGPCEKSEYNEWRQYEDGLGKGSSNSKLNGNLLIQQITPHLLPPLGCTTSANDTLIIHGNTNPQIGTVIIGFSKLNNLVTQDNYTWELTLVDDN